MRTLLRQVLIDNALIDVPEEAIVSGDADSVQQRPFVNLQWAENNPGLGPVTRRNLVVWFHDEPGDYSRIDTLVARTRAVFTSLSAVQAPEGSWLVEVRWETDSGDLRDDARGTIVRTSTYLVVGSGM